MMTSDETVAVCALNKVLGFQPARAAALVNEAGGALALFDGTRPELDPSQLDWAFRELERIRSGGFRFLTLWDEEYPDLLRECSDPPVGLYLNGTSSPAEIFGLRPMVAFVGTRDISPYGKAWCQKLVRALAEAHVPPVIVSGLALGADGIAHKTALECGLPTIGVMATGIETVYPIQHESLAMEIVRSPGGALVTDYPLGSQPMAWTFLRRNRIIAGLSRATVVVESKAKGGSLMTARFAVDYGRDVLAVPGRLDDLRSAGCNSLIHEHMAEIITSPEGLVDALGLGGRRKHRGAGASWVTSQAGDPPEKVLQALLTRKYGPGSALIPVALAVLAQRGISPEELTASLRRPYGEILSAIGTLEADGFLTTDLLRRCSLTF